MNAHTSHVHAPTRHARVSNLDALVPASWTLAYIFSDESQTAADDTADEFVDTAFCSDIARMMKMDAQPLYPRVQSNLDALVPASWTLGCIFKS